MLVISALGPFIALAGTYLLGAEFGEDWCRWVAKKVRRQGVQTVQQGVQ